MTKKMLTQHNSYIKKMKKAFLITTVQFKLRHKSMPKVIYLKGNIQFYKNPKLSTEKVHNLGVDRIVYEPEIPV